MAVIKKNSWNMICSAICKFVTASQWYSVINSVYESGLENDISQRLQALVLSRSVSAFEKALPP